MAKKLWDNRAANRSHRMWRSQKISNDIKAGEWKNNGETIKINQDGKMEDGQHRCMAVILSNTPIEVTIAFGIPPDSFDTIDQGAARSNADMLCRDGEKYSGLLASALTWLSRYETGIDTGIRSALSRKACRVGLGNNPGIRKSLPIGARTKSKLLPASIVVTLHYLFAKKSRKGADVFFNALTNGENISPKSRKTSAIYHLRRLLESDLTAIAKLPHKEVFKGVVQAWSMSRKGEVCKKFKIPSQKDLPSIV
jgi:hypothetical protein